MLGFLSFLNKDNSMYAIKVKFAENDWLYVVEDNGDTMNMKPVKYPTLKEAKVAAKGWVLPGKDSNVKVVEYPKDI